MINKIIQSVKRALLGVAIASAPMVTQAVDYVPNATFPLILTNNSANSLPANGSITNLSGVFTNVLYGSNSFFLTGQRILLNPRFGMSYDVMFRTITNTVSVNTTNTVGFAILGSFSSDGTNAAGFYNSGPNYTFSNYVTASGTTNWQVARIYFSNTNFDSEMYLMPGVITNLAVTTNTMQFQFFNVNRPRLPVSTSFYPTWP